MSAAGLATMKRKSSLLSSRTMTLFKKVWLHDCSIGLRGVKVIAGALKLNQSVWWLIYSEHFGDECAEAVLLALDYNVCVRRLHVGRSTSDEPAAKIKHRTGKRNGFRIPAAVRRACLYLIAARRTPAQAGALAVLPKEIVKMIAMQVWATRKDPIWIEALSKSKSNRKSGD